MDSPILLEYPNGRVHKMSLTTPAALEPGYHFDMHGRHWSAIKLVAPPRGRRQEPQRMLCTSENSSTTPAPTATDSPD
jgi:hypothetical protein